MKTLMNGILLGLGLLLSSASPVAAKTIHFGGYDWAVRSGHGGPGPNTWDASNVWLDASGALQLKISHRDGKWACAEVTTQKRMGFGRYQLQVAGRIDEFDDNVVLGLFDYPIRDVGVDEMNEIDIEIARWGRPTNPMGNFTLTGNASTHRLDWSSAWVLYKSLQGHRDDDQEEFARWTFEPADHLNRIA